MMHSIVAFLLGLLSLGGPILGASPVIQVTGGGTGTSSIPANYVLIGKDGNRITAVSTSSLGIASAADGAFSTTSATYFSSLGLSFSTTSTDYWKSVNNFFSTTSASHFSSVGLAFSTTSSNYWAALGLGFSTTSANYWETQQTARTADDLTNNSIEDLNDVAAMTEATGDLLGWNGTTWTNRATSTLFNTAASGVTGLLSGTDWTTFNSKMYSFATSTLSATSPLTGSFIQVGTGGTLGIQQGTAGQNGYLASADWTSFNSRLSTSTAQTLAGQGLFFSTTSNNFWASTGLGFSTTSSDFWASTGRAYSTTSANYWSSVGLGFSTTSTNYWSSLGLGHSTTSVAYQLTQNVTLGNATATNFFATLASSTRAFSTFASSSVQTVTGSLYLSGLNCSANTNGGALTVGASGLVSCSDDDSGGGSSGNMSGWATSTTAWSQLILYPVNGSEDVVFGGTGSGATTSAPFWWDVSATTSYIGNGGAGDSSITFGPNGSQFISGYYNTDSTYRISRGTSLGTDNLLSIKRSTGTFGIGSSTPWGLLSAASSTLGSTGYTIAIATNGYADMFAHSTTSGPRPGPRVSIGTTSRSYIGDRWAFVVNGPIYSTWDMSQCNTISAFANLTADSTFNQVCGDFLFDEDAQGATSLASTTPTGIPYATIWAGATAVRTAVTAAGDGAAIIPIGTGSTGLFTASSSPGMEVWIQASSTNATSTIFMVGFWQGAFGSDYAPSDATVAVTPGFGLVGTSSNWMAVVKNGTATAHFSDTGVAISSVTSDYTHQKINIDVLQLTADTYRVYFDINDVTRTWIDIAAGGGTRQLVNPRISVGARTAGNAKNIRVLQPIRVYQKMVQY